MILNEQCRFECFILTIGRDFEVEEEHDHI